MLDPFAERPLPTWFDEAKLGVFLHWGLYSVPAWAPQAPDIQTIVRELGVPHLLANSPYAEWYANTMQVDGSPTQRHHRESYGPHAGYDSFVSPFQSESATADLDELASTCAAAGARYVVLTTKHHDGFCLWPTDVHHPVHGDRWRAERDLVGDLSAAVRDRGMRMGLYYSGGFDWSVHPLVARNVATLLLGVPQTRRYADYCDAHYRELIDRYQPSVLWNDIAAPTLLDLTSLFGHYYEQVPDGVVNDRWTQISLPTGGATDGLIRGAGWLIERAWPLIPSRHKGLDFSVRPQHHDFTTHEYARKDDIELEKWESTRGVGHSFGANQNEAREDVVTGPDLVRSFVDIVAKGGNLLIGIGPSPDGTVPSWQRAPPRRAGRLAAGARRRRVRHEAVDRAVRANRGRHTDPVHPQRGIGPRHPAGVTTPARGGDLGGGRLRPHRVEGRRTGCRRDRLAGGRHDPDGHAARATTAGTRAHAVARTCRGHPPGQLTLTRRSTPGIQPVALTTRPWADAALRDGEIARLGIPRARSRRTTGVDLEGRPRRGRVRRGSSVVEREPVDLAHVVLHGPHGPARSSITPTRRCGAHMLFTADVHYIVKDDRVVLVDEFTGRMMEGRRFSEGLHQALEAKEGVRIQEENQTLASITFQNYFRLYPKLAGMTGTAMTEAGEFAEIYNLEVVDIPTHLPCVRVDHDDEVYRTAEDKTAAIVELIEDCRTRGQPCLVGTTSIEKSEHLAKLLKKRKIKHQVLNARYHEQEAFIIAQAGTSGAVTIATNMAGRGTTFSSAATSTCACARSSTIPATRSARPGFAPRSKPTARRWSKPAASTSSARSATRAGGSTTSSGAARGARATRARRSSSCPWKTT